jgi:hypothetical protein
MEPLMKDGRTIAEAGIDVSLRRVHQTMIERGLLSR